MKRLTAVAICVLALSGCSEDVPQDPTWFGNVQNILTANCARCHGPIKAPGVPPNLRFDRYEDSVANLDRILARAVDPEGSGATPMPPDSYLSNAQKDTLAIWIDNGGLRGTREINRNPRAELVEPRTIPDSADQELTLRFRVTDPDGDGVKTSLGYREAGKSGAVTVVAEDLPGIPEFTIDTGVLQDQRRFDFFAILDDGYLAVESENRVNSPILENLLMDHGDRGTAPTVTLLSPQGLVFKPMTTISWTATDPDEGDVLTIDLTLLQTDQTGNEISSEIIAQGLGNDVQSFEFATDSLPEEENGSPVFYQVQVTASDPGGESRSAKSPPFSLVTLGWEADIKPMMAKYCTGCHGSDAISGSVDYFRLDKYDAADTEGPADSEIGAFEMRDKIYEQVVVRGAMPQLGSMSTDDKSKLTAWLLADAPF